MLAVDNDFKISVILGVAGTFLFFFSLSGFLLELAKRSKKFYYNGLNMFVLRQINSKITTTFVSMSMLCLMLFLAISAFATGSGLASSVKTDLEDMTKFDYYFLWSIRKRISGRTATEIYEKIRCAWINK